MQRIKSFAYACLLLAAPLVVIWMGFATGWRIMHPPGRYMVVQEGRVLVDTATGKAWFRGAPKMPSVNYHWFEIQHDELRGGEMKRKATTGSTLAALGVQRKARRKRSTSKAATPVTSKTTAGRGPRLTVYLDPELHAELLRYVGGRMAAGNKVSYSDVVSDALRAYLPKR